MDNTTITVSVVVITYNHARFIAQCLDSILAQKIAVAYEVLVGEDGSLDGTREICVKYAEQHPDKIRLFLNDRKNVIYIDGRPTGRWNFINLLKHAKGKYIALCEGDDYWTSPDKLQKQVDFLEGHPDFAICFHNSEIIYEEVNKDSHFSNKNQKEVTTIYDVIRDWYIMTATMVFRQSLIQELPDWFVKPQSGDYALQMLLSQYGKIFYFDEVMSVYRKHYGGASHKYQEIMFVNSMLRLLQIFNRHSKFKYNRAIKERISTIYANLASLQKRRSLTYWQFILKHLWYNPSKFKLLTTIFLNRLK